MTDDTVMDPPDPFDEPTPEELAALGALLGNKTAWEELPPELEDLVVAAIAPATAVEEPMPTARRWPRWLAVAAVALVTVGVGALVAQTGGNTLTGPTTTEFALSPTDLGQNATGTVKVAALRNGLRIILAVDSLPPAPQGQFYEAWMRSPDAGVSAGTFHMRGETGEIELWAGVLSDAYPVLSITLEDEDGDATSSGRVVMTADLSQPLGG